MRQQHVTVSRPLTSLRDCRVSAPSTSCGDCGRCCMNLQSFKYLNTTTCKKAFLSLFLFRILIAMLLSSASMLDSDCVCEPVCEEKGSAVGKPTHMSKSSQKMKTSKLDCKLANLAFSRGFTHSRALLWPQPVPGVRSRGRDYHTQAYVVLVPGSRSEVELAMGRAGECVWRRAHACVTLAFISLCVLERCVVAVPIPACPQQTVGLKARTTPGASQINLGETHPI